MTQKQILSALLVELEQALKDAGCWSLSQPPEKALVSPLPFSLDTLSGVQWLQWIFIPKLSQCLAENLPLPENLEITPYIEQTLDVNISGECILSLCQQLDNLFTVGKTHE